MTKKTDSKDINAMGRGEVYAALGEHFNIAAEEISKSFSPYQTEILRSVLATAITGKETEKTFLLTGAGITGLAGITLANPLLSISCGLAATIGIYAAQRISRKKLENGFIDCVHALENGRPKNKPMP